MNPKMGHHRHGNSLCLLQASPIPGLLLSGPDSALGWFWSPEQASGTRADSEDAVLSGLQADQDTPAPCQHVIKSSVWVCRHTTTGSVQTNQQDYVLFLHIQSRLQIYGDGESWSSNAQTPLMS